MAVAVQLLALRLPQAVISQTTSHVIVMQFKHFCTQILNHPKDSRIADLVFFSVVDPRIRIGFHADLDQLFISLRIQIRIQGTKPMLINADPDPGHKEFEFLHKKYT